MGLKKLSFNVSESGRVYLLVGSKCSTGQQLIHAGVRNCIMTGKTEDMQLNQQYEPLSEELCSLFDPGLFVQLISVIADWYVIRLEGKAASG